MSDGGALREVVAFFGLDVDKGSFKDMDSKVNRLRDGITSLARVFAGGVIVNELRKIVSTTAAAGVAVTHTAQKLGMTTGALQELTTGAELADVASGAMEGALARLSRTASDAGTGSKAAAEMFDQIGVSVKGADGTLRPTDELLGDVADKMKGMKDQGDRLRVAYDLFGREGADIVTVLGDGSEGLARMRAEARALGGIMEDDLIAQTMAYDDAMDVAGETLKGFRNIIAGALLPAVTDVVKSISAWARANREVISDVVLRGFRFLRELLSSLWQLASFVARGFEKVWRWLDPLQQKLVVLAAVLGGLVLLMGVWPAIILGVVAALEDLAAFFRGENSVTGIFVQWIKQLTSDLLANPIDPNEVWIVRVLQLFVKLVRQAVDEMTSFKNGGGVGTIASMPFKLGAEALRNVAGFKGLAPLLGNDQAPDFITKIGTAPSTAPLAAGGAGPVDARANVTNNIVVNGAGDPKAVGGEVAKQVKETLGQTFARTVRGALPRAKENPGAGSF